MKKRLIAIFLISALLLTALVSCKSEEDTPLLSDTFYDETDEITNLVKMNITYTNSKGKTITGDIVVELNPIAAPITVQNFQKLVSEDFYDGLIFHRVIKDFMIQGGDPKGNGTGGSANTIKGEFSANGISNPLKHVRGVISMARSDSFDSASSQFFIMHQDKANLNGLYAAFGKVVFGMETVDGIANVTTNSSNNKPLNQAVINYMTFVVPKGESAQNKTISVISADQAYKTSTDITNFVKMNITCTDSNGYTKNGDIVVELNPSAAPITVANFQKLVSEGFYDGLTFHRVIKDFMIQGGDPKGDGTGGSANTIKGEFSANGISNPIKHVRGVISMARSKANDSASSQFFIMHKTSPHLDGQYAAFGMVILGMEMVDEIAAVTTNNNDMPLRQVVINHMNFVVPTVSPTTPAQ